MSNPLVGTWKLKAFDITRPNGDVLHPFGANPEGYIIYTESGHVSVALLNTSGLGQLLKVTRIPAAASYQSYAGTFEVNDNKVIHHADVSLDPRWHQASLERTFDLVENRLVLQTPTWSGAGQPRLVWERV